MAGLLFLRETGPSERERPRERLLARGPGALSDAELVSVLLRTGGRGEPVEALAARLLAEAGGLRGLLNAPAARLLGVRGISDAKACALLAAAEVARRRLLTPPGDEPVTRAVQAAPLLAPLFAGLAHEAFGALFLDARHRPLAAELLFHGGGAETPVYPGEITRRALLHSARAVIVAHNHPSGDLAPSREDEAVTRRVSAALATVEIRLLDHLVIHGERWRSVGGNEM